MKKVKKAIALAAMILGGSVTTFAQNGITIRVGGGFPIGAFGQGEKVTELALNNPEATFGGSTTGINAGFKYQFGIINNLGVFATADFFYNDLKDDVKDAMNIEGTESTTPAYINVPIMLGFNYSFLNLPNGIALWAEAGAGVNFSNITSKTIEYSTEVPFIGSLNGSSTSTYDMSSTFAWQAGIGACLGQNITLGLHYYHLGASSVNYETAVDASAAALGSLDINNILGENGEFTAGKLTPSMIVARLGYTF